YCIQREDEGCRFECHCVNHNECRGGICPSGCHRAALGYNWGGPACQIGNVGLYKAANMTAIKTNYNISYPPTGALDGILGVPNINQHCAYPINAANLAAECKITRITNIDCSNCPSDVTCYDVTGCQKCVGSYQPECKPAPDSPTVWNVTATATDLDTVSDLNPNCDQINEVSLNYELTDGVKHSKIITSLTDNMATIVPEEVGQYQIWITVTNNEGYSSDSEKYTISIKSMLNLTLMELK
ncbi:hypothetical protein LSH36_286g02015, partial [Paralvinella palmiformis]